jgi:hypothetical protein
MIDKGLDGSLSCVRACVPRAVKPPPLYLLLRTPVLKLLERCEMKAVKGKFAYR